MGLDPHEGIVARYNLHHGHVLKDLYVTFLNVTKGYEPAFVTLYRITLRDG